MCVLRVCESRNAALFLWIDLSDYLPPLADAWIAERQLTQILLDSGVYLAPGGDFRSEQPGWFRIVFSMPAVEEGIMRWGVSLCGLRARMLTCTRVVKAISCKVCGKLEVIRCKLCGEQKESEEGEGSRGRQSE